MKELWTLDDSGKWGLALRTEAEKRGIKTRVIRSAADINHASAVFFARISQDLHSREKELPIVKKAESLGVVLVPDINLLDEYEDKVYQFLRYETWMPFTNYFKHPAGAHEGLDDFDFPFVSKSRTGSASCNVRMINDRREALAEIESAFSERGIVAPHSLGEREQKGYLLWQEFIPKNDYDYRSCIVGDLVMLLRRRNRTDKPFASGSGLTEPITFLNDETKSLLDYSFKFFDHFGMEFAGIDVVRDHISKKWRMLETTIGWKQSAYTECVFFDREGTPQAFGADLWSVFCDFLVSRYL